MYLDINDCEAQASKSHNSGVDYRSSKSKFNQMVSEGYSVLMQYQHFLSPLDQDLLRMYYVYGMGQQNIASVMGWVQAAVSRRVNSVFDRVRFLIRRPTNNAIQAREELAAIFPEEMFEYAYFFYWELTQNKVRMFIETSQSGAANKITSVIEHLEEEKVRYDAMTDPDLNALRNHALVGAYLSYFKFIRERSNILSFLYKKNDRLRSDAHCLGESVTQGWEVKGKYRRF